MKNKLDVVQLSDLMPDMSKSTPLTMEAVMAEMIKNSIAIQAIKKTLRDMQDKLYRMDNGGHQE